MERHFKMLQDAVSQIETLQSLEKVLIQEIQYFKFIETKLIPEVGEEKMFVYLKGIIKKEMNQGTFTRLRDLNVSKICKIAFNSNSYGNKNYLFNRYPILYGIISKVIGDMKNENNWNVESIVKMCKCKISERESLKIPLQLYKENVDWKYLGFVEKVLIPEVGECEFYQYILDFQFILLDQGIIKANSFNELLQTLIDGAYENNRQIFYAKERYPRLTNMIEEALNDKLKKTNHGEKYRIRQNILSKTEMFNKLSERDFVKKAKDIINREFNEKRIRLNKIRFYKVLYNESVQDKNYNYEMLKKRLIHYNTLNQLLEIEKIKQLNYVESWNRKSISLNKDIWIVHFVKGLSIHSMNIDFTLINHKQLRRELKTYLFHQYSSEYPIGIYRTFRNITRGLGVIQEEFEIEKLSDIGKLHALYIYQKLEIEYKYALPTIRKTLSSLSGFSDYFFDKIGYSDRVIENVFKPIVMKNLESMSKNTEFIPDEVISQLNTHLSELDSTYRLMYELYSYTGLRAYEVVLLKKDCFDEDYGEYAGYVRMNYIPFKIRKARRKRGLSDISFVYIPKELAQKVKEYIAGNESLYSTHGINYVFARRSTAGVFVPQTRDFCVSINKIIKKYNICNLEGEIWNFTAQQIRKTVAVNLIDNNATPQEVANQLGHLSIETTEKYYLEVKKLKLAKMNSEFFKNKFEISVGKENLDLYSEEERRQLYVDFCLNKREVELGTCSKHISEGECGKRVGVSNCAVCPKLCTGKKYLSKWSELKESQLKIINELKRIYRDKGIEDYHEFIEYKKELFLFERYSSVVDKIMESDKR